MFNWPVNSGGGFTFNFNIELLNLDLKIFTIQCDLILNSDCKMTPQDNLLLKKNRTFVISIHQ